MSVTQEIKSRLDIVDIVSEYVPLRKSGRSYAGFCPFHHNTRTPAFYVFPETQTWHCFGACAEGGDLFSFLMKKEGWDFKEALTRLATRAGVTLEPEKPVDKKKKARHQQMADLLGAATDYFMQLFLHAPQAEAARAYVTNRGLSAQTIETFGIGFALDSWDACRTHFNAQGYSDEELLAAGLLTENEERGTRYDRFRNRLMIPIRNIDGQVVGFGARTLEKDGIPKYLNSPQTELFDKSHLLFGLDLAKRDIREARQVVIVEGYMDVMQAWQAGFRNVVAQMGTALTESQLNLLKRYTRRFVLALDADAAGIKATMRSLQVARETLDRETEVRFDAHGLVKHEGRLQAEIRIVTLPEGQDPDNIIRADPSAWPKLLARAKPVVAYVIDVATQDLDMSNAKQKTAVAQQVIPLIKDIPEPLERDHYWQLLARTLQVEERALRQVRVTERPSRGRPAAPAPSGKSVLPDRNKRKMRQQLLGTGTPIATEMREANYLSQCLHHPLMLRAVNDKLQAIAQPCVKNEDFSAAEDRAIFQQIMQWADRQTFAPLQELWDSLDVSLIDRVNYLHALPPTPDSEVDRLADKLALSVLDWRLEKKSQLVTVVKQLVNESRGETDADAHAILQQLNELTVAKLNIDKARDALSATSRRRARDAANGRF